MLGWVAMAKVAESVSVTARTLESAAGVFQLSKVASARVDAVRGSYAGRWLGVMSALIALGFGGCCLVADAMTKNHDGAWIVAALFFGGVALYAWSAWLAPARFLVVLNLGGSEVAVAQYRDAANAVRVVEAVREALSRLGD